MLIMRIYITSVFMLFVSQYTTASSRPMQDVPFEGANIDREVVRDAAVESGLAGAEVTTEGVMSSMWHKITNFFATDTSTSGPPEMVLEKQQRSFGRRAVRRAVPPETRKGHLHHDVRRMLKERAVDNKDEGGVLAPSPSSSEVKRSARGMRYAKVFQDYDAALQVRGNPANSNDQEDEGKAYIEEFDEGQLGADRKKRFQDEPSDMWITEKISEGSDPVENIDKENYIEEIMEDPFLLHERTFRPILVEDELTASID